MKLAVIVFFVIKLLPYIKLVEDRDFGNLVEGVGVSFSYIYFGGCSLINVYLSYFSVLWLNTL